jgi:hypothetical protein
MELALVIYVAALVHFQMNAVTAFRHRRIAAIEQMHFLDALIPLIILLEFHSLLVGSRIKHLLRHYFYLTRRISCLRIACRIIVSSGARSKWSRGQAAKLGAQVLPFALHP